jgi:hypothetical protein
MKVIATRKGTKWYAVVEEDGMAIVSSHTGEPRPGCAIRQVLNKLQITYGQPAGEQVVLTIDEW